jgi:hypothetical protein
MGWRETGKPLDPKSLQKHFALDIGTGAVEANFLVGSLIYATILGLQPRLAQWPLLTSGCAASSRFLGQDQDGLEGNQRG